MKIELLEEKVVFKGKHVIEINYNELNSVPLKVKKNYRRVYFLLFYLISFFIVFSKIYMSLFITAILFFVLCIVLFYKFDTIKANAIFFCKDKKIKIALDNEDLESTIALIDMLQLIKYKKLTSNDA